MSLLRRAATMRAALLYLAFMLCSPGLLIAGTVMNARTDSLLKVLDTELQRAPEYEQLKRDRLNRLWSKKHSAIDDSEKFNFISQLFKEYKNYNMDTTVLLAREGLSIARKLDIDSLTWEAVFMEAEGLKGMGNYQESLRVLKSLSPEGLERNKFRFYNRVLSVYLSMYENIRPLPEADEYRRKLLAYRDSISDLDPSLWGQAVARAESLKLMGEPEKALQTYEILLEQLKDTPDDNPAVMWHVIGETYAMVGQDDKAIEFLTLSAIEDMRNNIRNYVSLQELAQLLNKHGDPERAYRYIMRTFNDIGRSHARSRIYHVADIMPVINDAYVAKSRQSSRNMVAVICLVSLVALIMVVLLMVIRERNLRLARQHKLLDASNAQLLKGQQEMESLNASLRELNEKLSESNSIKEKYIGYLFSLCSDYIEQTDKYRKSVVQQIKVRKYAEAEKLLAKAPKELSMKSFLREFDAIFLNMFPHFVERFNELLVPEARVTPPEGELLTTELRIYALVRLGISDSAKIALFLNYSIQTVYNYRQRMRNNACIPKNEFADTVRKIKP